MATTHRRLNQHSRPDARLVARTCWVVGWISALALVVVPPAWAHPNHQGERPVVERITPSVDGVEVHGLADGFGKLALTTTGSTSAEVLAASGQPILRVGPGGVEANQAAPDWYVVNEPLGIAQVPPSATPESPERWVRVSTRRTWEWFDHRLHPAGSRAKQWSIPIVADGVKAAIKGRTNPPPGVLEYRVRPKRPAPKVTVSALNMPSAALRVQNEGDAPVSVLGPDGEVFARIGPNGAEVNVHSTVWIPTAQYRNRASEFLTDVVDPAKKPKFVGVSPAAELIWPEPAMLPPSALPALTGASRLRGAGDVASWSVQLVVKGSSKPIAIKGTTFLGAPLPAETAPPTDAAKTADTGTSGLLIGLVIAATVAMIVAVLLVGRRGRRTADGGPGDEG